MTSALPLPKPTLMLLEESGVQVGRATQVISARLADAELSRVGRIDARVWVNKLPAVHG